MTCFSRWLEVVFLSFFIPLFFFATQVSAEKSQPPAARLTYKTGTVEIFSGLGDSWGEASVGQSLFVGSIVRTGVDGKAALLMADETLIQLGRNSQFVLHDVAPRAGWRRLRGLVPASLQKKGSSYQLKKGKLWLLNKDVNADVSVQTPTVTAAIRGTELTVVVEPDETVRVAVLEGLVDVRNEFGATAVAAGEEAVTKPGTAPVKTVLLQPEDAVQWTIVVPPLITSEDFSIADAEPQALREEKDRLLAAEKRGTATAGDLARLGFVQRDLGNLVAARTVLERLRQQQPRSAAALAGLGWLNLDAGLPAEALQLFTEADAGEVTVILGKLVAMIQLRQHPEAMRLLAGAVRVYPQRSDFRALGAWLQLMSGEVKEAQIVLAQITKSHPEDAFGWELLALAALVRDQKDAAAVAVAEAIRLAPASSLPLILHGYLAQARFDLETAEKDFLAALVLAPDNVTASVALARIQFGKGYLAAAEATLAKAADLAPDNGEVQNLRGFLLLAAKKQEEAVTAFVAAVKVAPAMAEPHLGLALSYLRLGKTDLGLEEMCKAVLLEPRRSLLRSYWAKILYQLNRHQKALDVLAIARNIDALDPTPELYRAIILRDLNRPTEAITALNKAIALNDNRGVYRSRLLLDQDLAVKNVNLALLYDQLGLGKWARHKASQSIRDDYTNASAHLFYAGSLAGDADRSWARNTENLLARLLQPANNNTFNSFNEYTSFVEKPSLDGTVVLGAGNHATTDQQYYLSGAAPQQNVAFQAGYLDNGTSGWRNTNNDAARHLVGYLKWDATRDDSLMLVAAKSDGNGSDKISPLYEDDDPAEPRDRDDSRSNRLEVGYLHSFAPDAKLLLHAQQFDRARSNLLVHTDLGTVVVPPALDGERIWQIAVDQPYHQLQGELLLRLAAHQLLAGAVHYRSSANGAVDGQQVWSLAGVPVLTLPEMLQANQVWKSQSYYLQDIVALREDVDLEMAIHLDRMQTGNIFLGNGTEWVVDEFSPQLGISWQASANNTFRVAAFRYLMPFYSDRLAPADIAGVPLYRNGSPGTVSQEGDLVWEHEWQRGFFSTGLFYLDSAYASKNATGAMGTRQTRNKGGEVALNQLFGLGFGARANYRYQNISDAANGLSREDHLLAAGINWVHPAGFSAGLQQSFRAIDFVDSPRQSEEMWTTDLDAAYQLPRKRGELKAEVRNLFNNRFNWVTDNFVFQGNAPAVEYFLTLTLNL